MLANIQQVPKCLYCKQRYNLYNQLDVIMSSNSLGTNY